MFRVQSTSNLDRMVPLRLHAVAVNAELTGVELIGSSSLESRQVRQGKSNITLEMSDPGHVSGHCRNADQRIVNADWRAWSRDNHGQVRVWRATRRACWSLHTDAYHAGMAPLSLNAR